MNGNLSKMIGYCRITSKLWSFEDYRFFAGLIIVVLTFTLNISCIRCLKLTDPSQSDSSNSIQNFWPAVIVVVTDLGPNGTSCRKRNLTFKSLPTLTGIIYVLCL